MEIGRIEGCTRVCGKSQGFLGLPLRDVIVVDKVMGPSPFMVSAWEPTPAELDKLRAGGRVHVWINGTSPPPMMVEVGDPPLVDGPPGPLGFFPIATAPKDGAAILIYRPSNYHNDSFHVVEWGGGVWVLSDGNTIDADVPTHWQPLPAVPEPA